MSRWPHAGSPRLGRQLRHSADRCGYADGLWLDAQRQASLGQRQRADGPRAHHSRGPWQTGGAMGRPPAGRCSAAQRRGAPQAASTHGACAVGVEGALRGMCKPCARRPSKDDVPTRHGGLARSKKLVAQARREACSQSPRPRCCGHMWRIPCQDKSPSRSGAPAATRRRVSVEGVNLAR